MKHAVAACALAIAGVSACVGSAQATTYVEEVSVSRYVACYNKVYVPAKVLVNTRGQLVRGEDASWEISPTMWNRVRDPAVYVQTRKTIEPDHYTLVKAGCP